MLAIWFILSKLSGSSFIEKTSSFSSSTGVSSVSSSFSCWISSPHVSNSFSTDYSSKDNSSGKFSSATSSCSEFF